LHCLLNRKQLLQLLLLLLLLPGGCLLYPLQCHRACHLCRGVAYTAIGRCGAGGKGLPPTCLACHLLQGPAYLLQQAGPCGSPLLLLLQRGLR
jgi:hypothetical protein